MGPKKYDEKNDEKSNEKRFEGKKTPVSVQPLSATEVFLKWNDGEGYALPYVELRFHCPCAGCVDENTGQRILERTSVSPDICATDVQLVGRYAIQFTWSDGHNTGMYHFDRLYELCQKQGRKMAQ